MNRSFRGFLSLAVACAVAAASLAVAATVDVARTVYATCRDFKNTLVDSFLALAKPTPGHPVAVPFLRAKAFVLRLAKRERPVVTNSWRMCPSI